MRAILIDPNTQTITEVENGGSLEDLYAALRADPDFSGTIDRVSLGSDVDLWCDDNGHLTDGRATFPLGEYIIAGAALLLAHDEMGESESLPAFVTVADLQRRIAWQDFMTTGAFEPGRKEVVDHPILGPNTTVTIGGEPILRPARGFAVWLGTALATSATFDMRNDALAYARTVKGATVKELEA